VYTGLTSMPDSVSRRSVVAIGRKYARRVRVLALALVAVALSAPSAAATPPGPQLLVRDGNHLTLVGRETVAAGPYQPLAFSGDGRLFSIGGRIVGRAKLPTRWLVWAPTGERAAYVTSQGGVVEWTPAGTHRLEPNGWGARWWWSPSVAWSRNGALAVARGSSLWILRGGTARQLVGPVEPACCPGGPGIPVPFAWIGDHVLWWAWPGSGSIAADGVSLWEDGTRLGTTLMYRDYAAVCGAHLAFVSGGDRYSTAGKSIVFDGGDASRDPRLSWVSPACSADGRLVAAAGTNTHLKNLTETHRAIWQLLPARRRLTRPPWGWSDEDPHLLPDGGLLFVRSRIHSVRNGDTWRDTQKGRVMLLAHGKLRRVAEIGYVQDEDKNVYLGPYYGHYDWSPFLAVRP